MITHCSTLFRFSVFVDFLTLRVGSDVPSESMAQKGLADPMFAKVLNQFSLGAQQYLNESGLFGPRSLRELPG